jgi:hypothetical protein|tara:strand:+ start:509 stop:1648 length:1140 start_codon:yes stop_codon:yes gene_type:complete
MTKGILRDVSYEIDKFEMDHYNDEKKGMFEHVHGFLNEIDESSEDLYSKKHIDPERLSGEIQESLMEARCHIDEMESIGVQNGLVRSKHLQNLMLAAKIRDTRDTDNYDDPDIDHVEQKVPWYKVDNLIEKLYLKYHKTRIHECFDTVQRYLIDDESECRGVYVFWKEIDELWEEVFDEETLSNHYHDDDDYWDHDIDPKECKNLPDFFRKRIAAKIEERKEKERILLEQAKEDKEKEKELKIIRAKEHKLRNYTSIEEFSKNQQGSVYWFIDVNKRFTKYSRFKFGILYVGESKNFDKRFSAYAIKSKDKFTELESKLSKKFPDVDKDSIQKFVRDPSQCKLMVKRFNFLSDDTKRLEFERRIIRISQPLLNKGGRLH